MAGTGDAVCMAYNLMCCRLEAGEEGKNNRKDTLNPKLVFELEGSGVGGRIAGKFILTFHNSGFVEEKFEWQKYSCQ